MSILVFGHKNPDTDTICSAIAYAEQIVSVSGFLCPKTNIDIFFPPKF